MQLFPFHYSIFCFCCTRTEIMFVTRCIPTFLDSFIVKLMPKVLWFSFCVSCQCLDELWNQVLLSLLLLLFPFPINVSGLLPRLYFIFVTPFVNRLPGLTQTKLKCRTTLKANSVKAAPVHSNRERATNKRNHHFLQWIVQCCTTTIEAQMIF